MAAPQNVVEQLASLAKAKSRCEHLNKTSTRLFSTGPGFRAAVNKDSICVICCNGCGRELNEGNPSRSISDHTKQAEKHKFKCVGLACASGSADDPIDLEGKAPKG